MKNLASRKTGFDARTAVLPASDSVLAVFVCEHAAAVRVMVLSTRLQLGRVTKPCCPTFDANCTISSQMHETDLYWLGRAKIRASMLKSA